MQDPDNIEIRNMFRAFSTGSYVLLVILLLVSFNYGGSDGSVILTLFAIVAAGALSAILGIGWRRGVGYPWSSYRRRAAWLWFYSTPLTLFANWHLARLGLPWIAQVGTNIVIFLYITTLTFGALPKLRGAYDEFLEIVEHKEIQRRVVEQARNLRPERLRESGGLNDLPSPKTTIAAWDVCNKCLTALIPDEPKCWRCDSAERWHES